MKTFRKFQKASVVVGMVYGLWLGCNVDATDKDSISGRDGDRGTVGDCSIITVDPGCEAGRESVVRWFPLRFDAGACTS